MYHATGSESVRSTRKLYQGFGPILPKMSGTERVAKRRPEFTNSGLGLTATASIAFNGFLPAQATRSPPEAILGDLEGYLACLCLISMISLMDLGTSGPLAA